MTANGSFSVITAVGISTPLVQKTSAVFRNCTADDMLHEFRINNKPDVDVEGFHRHRPKPLCLALLLIC